MPHQRDNAEEHRRSAKNNPPWPRRFHKGKGAPPLHAQAVSILQGSSHQHGAESAFGFLESSCQLRAFFRRVCFKLCHVTFTRSLPSAKSKGILSGETNQNSHFGTIWLLKFFRISDFSGPLLSIALQPFCEAQGYVSPSASRLARGNAALLQFSNPSRGAFLTGCIDCIGINTGDPPNKA